MTKTKEIRLHAYSVPGFVLPTFSTGRIKTVYWKWWIFKIPVARYLFFTCFILIPGVYSKYPPATCFVYDIHKYVQTYIKLPTWKQQLKRRILLLLKC